MTTDSSSLRKTSRQSARPGSLGRTLASVLGSRRDVVRLFLVTALVGVSAYAGLLMVARSGVCAFWPANGLLLAFLLTSPRRRWAGYLVGGAIANIIVHALSPTETYNVWTSVQLSVANIIEVLIAAWPFRRTVPRRPDFTEGASLGRFILFGVVLAPLASGLWVVVTMPGLLSLYTTAVKFRLWSSADALGLAIVTPLVLALLDPRIVRLFSGWRLLETILLEAMLVVTTIAVFRSERLPYPLIVLLVLIPVIFRLGLPGSAIGVVLIAGIATRYTFAGQGLFAHRLSFMYWSLMLQSYVVMLLGIIYGIAAVLGRYRRLTDGLRASEMRYRVLAEASQDMIIRTKVDGAPTYISPSVTRVSGWTLDQLAAVTEIGEVVHAQDRAAFTQFMDELRHDSRANSLCYRAKRPDGTYLWLEAYVGVVPDAAGEPQELVWTIRDISSRVAQEETLRLEKEWAQELALTDSLTGLYNRRAFDQRFAEAFRHAQQTRLPLSLLLVDADHFKPYNDTYGHQSGDDCLRRIAGVIRECVRQSADVAARYGGEEFAIVLPNTDLIRAQDIAERIREKVARLDIDHSYSVTGQVTLSIGISCAHHGAPADCETLLASADEALYTAKRSGRNRVEVAL